MRVDQVMRKDVATLHASDPLSRAARILKETGCGLIRLWPGRLEPHGGHGHGARGLCRDLPAQTSPVPDLRGLGDGPSGPCLHPRDPAGGCGAPDGAGARRALARGRWRGSAARGGVEPDRAELTPARRAGRLARLLAATDPDPHRPRRLRLPGALSGSRTRCPGLFGRLGLRSKDPPDSFRQRLRRAQPRSNSTDD